MEALAAYITLFLLSLSEQCVNPTNEIVKLLTVVLLNHVVLFLFYGNLILGEEEFQQIPVILPPLAILAAVEAVHLHLPRMVT